MTARYFVNLRRSTEAVVCGWAYANGTAYGLCAKKHQWVESPLDVGWSCIKVWLEGDKILEVRGRPANWPRLPS